MTRTLIIFGAGPGIGNHVAAEFACKGIEHIILLSRNTERLEKEDAPFVSKSSSSVKVDTLRIDLADTKSIPDVLKQLDSMTEGEDVEVVFFNAARIKPNDVLGVSVEEIEEDFQVNYPFPRPPLRNSLTETTDNQSSPLRHSTALHPQTPEPGQVKLVAQARSSRYEQPPTMGSCTATPLT